MFLAQLGHLLVSEDPLEPVDVVAVTYPSMMGDILEAAALYREGYTPAIVFPSAAPEFFDAELRRLGGLRLAPAEYATWVLTQSGVPREAIRVLPDVSDGTASGIAAIARFAAAERPRRVLLVVSRNHSARAGWMLRHAVTGSTHLLVRTPRTDRFDPDGWWHSRNQTRDVAVECLRWINTFILGDPWR